MSRAHLALGRPHEALANAEESCSLHPSWPKVKERERGGGREGGRGGGREGEGVKWSIIVNIVNK